MEYSQPLPDDLSMATNVTTTNTATIPTTATTAPANYSSAERPGSISSREVRGETKSPVRPSKPAMKGTPQSRKGKRKTEQSPPQSDGAREPSSGITPEDLASAEKLMRDLDMLLQEKEQSVLNTATETTSLLDMSALIAKAKLRQKQAAEAERPTTASSETGRPRSRYTALHLTGTAQARTRPTLTHALATAVGEAINPEVAGRARERRARLSGRSPRRIAPSRTSPRKQQLSKRPSRLMTASSTQPI